MSQEKWTYERLCEVARDLTVPITIFGEGKIRFVNQAYLELTGFAEEEVLGKGPTDFLAPEERRRIQDAIAERQRLNEQGERVAFVRSYTLTTLAANGRRLKMHVQSTEAVASGVTYILSICHVHPEEVIQQGAFELLSSVASELLALRSEAAIRQTALQALSRAGLRASFFAPPFTEPSPQLSEGSARGTLELTYAEEAVRSGEPVFRGVARGRGLQPSSVYLPVRREGRPAELLVIEGELFAGMHSPTLSLFGRQLASAMDTAELVRSLEDANRELHETRQEMVKQERLAALGELSAIVAHEVRNPLGVIFNAVSSLRRGNADPSDQRLLLDILAEESDRLNRIVGDLLDFARPAALSLQPEALGKVIFEAVATSGAQLDPAIHVLFDLQVPEDLPAVPLDCRLIHQALVNVLVNAQQSMPRGGRVTVRATWEDAAQMVRVDVEDEGPGIGTDVLSHIFEPFFTTKAKGTGLGLAVVRRIIDGHRGDVSVKSAESGTTFTLRLPALAETRSAGKPLQNRQDTR